MQTENQKNQGSSSSVLTTPTKNPPETKAVKDMTQEEYQAVKAKLIG